jgi:hypothetical protein
MKKILLTLAAAFGLAIAGSGTAWAESLTVDGTNFTSNGIVSVTTTNSTDPSSNSNLKNGKNNAIKIKTDKGTGSVPYISINVTEGYKVTSLKGTVTTNGNSTNTITAVLVDGETTSLVSDALTIPAKGATTPLSFGTWDVAATSNIQLCFSAAAEIVFYFTITYEEATVEKPEGAIDVTLTNAFNTSSTDQPFTVSPEDNDFYSMSGYSSIGLTEGTITVDNAPMKLFTNPSVSDAITASEAHQIEFIVVPRKGITFVVTGVAFKAAKSGSDGPTIDCLIGANGGNYKTIASSLALARNNSTSLTVHTTSFSKTGLSISCTSEAYLSLCVRPTLPSGTTRGVELSDVEITGYYTGTAEEETTYTVSAIANDPTMGSVSQSPTGKELTENLAVSFTATANTGYKFINWINTESNEVISTNATYETTVTSNINITAVFEAYAAVTYVADDAEGVLPDNEYYDAGTKFTLPSTNYTLYKEGYTLTGWNDGTSDYDLGAEYTITASTKFTAVFTANEKSLAELVAEPRTNNLVVSFSFSQEDGPVLNCEGVARFYTYPTVINGETIDLKMAVDTRKSQVITDYTKNGKLNNTSNKTYAQVNKGTKLTIPVIAGGVVSINVRSGSLDSSTINGEKCSSYTATETGDIIIIIADENMWLYGIVVTYPQNAYAVKISDLGAATFSAPIATTIPQGVKAYAGVLSEDNATLTLQEVETVIPANEPVILFGEEGNYTFPEAAEAGTKVEGNALKAQLTAGVPAAEEGKVICVLNAVNDQIGFYKLNDGKTLGANKAYLPVPVATSSDDAAEAAPSVRIVFADETGNVTGIESIAADVNSLAPIFNLAGQKMQGRVAPGLYIQGGKKFLVK